MPLLFQTETREAAPSGARRPPEPAANGRPRDANAGCPLLDLLRRHGEPQGHRGPRRARPGPRRFPGPLGHGPGGVSPRERRREPVLAGALLRLHPRAADAALDLGPLRAGITEPRLSPPAPARVQIDADPWNPTFWQALLARRLFAPDAAVVLGPKKNTYREYDNAAGRAKRRLAEAGLCERTDFVLPASGLAKRMYERQLGFPAERMRVTTLVPVDVEAFRPAERRRPARRPARHRLQRPLPPAKGDHRPRRGGRPLRRQRRMAVRLRLLGSGPLKDDLAALARERDHLEILPPVPLRRRRRLHARTSMSSSRPRGSSSTTGARRPRRPAGARLRPADDRRPFWDPE